MVEIENPKRQRALEMKIVLPLCLTAFVGLLNVSAMSPFLPSIAEEFNVSVSAVGLASTVSLLTNAFGGLFIGPLSDSFGHRRSLLGGLLFIALSAVGMALSGVYAMMMSMRAVGGVGMSASSGIANAVAATRYTGRVQRRALSMVSGTAILAGLVGPPLLTLIGSVYGWRGAFFSVGLVGGLALALLMFWMPSDTAIAKTRTIRDSFSDYGILIRNSSMVMLYSSAAFQMCAMIGTMTYAGAFFIETHNFTIQMVGYALMVQAVGGVLGSWLAGGRLGDLGAERVYLVVMSLMAVSVTAFYGFAFPSPIDIGILAVTSFLQVTAWVCLVSMLAQRTPIGQGTTMVLSGSVLGIGGAVGSGFGGAVLAFSGYQALGLLFGISAALAMLVVLPLWRDPVVSNN